MGHTEGRYCTEQSFQDRSASLILILRFQLTIIELKVIITICVKLKLIPDIYAIGMFLLSLSF
jgi:hypothetical protein